MTTCTFYVSLLNLKVESLIECEVRGPFSWFSGTEEH